MTSFLFRSANTPSMMSLKVRPYTRPPMVTNSMRPSKMLMRVDPLIIEQQLQVDVPPILTNDAQGPLLAFSKGQFAPHKIGFRKGIGFILQAGNRYKCGPVSNQTGFFSKKSPHCGFISEQSHIARNHTFIIKIQCSGRSFPQSLS